MQDIFNADNIQAFLAVLAAIVATIAAGWAIQWNFFKHRLQRQEDIHKAEISNLNAGHNKTCADMQLQLIRDNQELKNALQSEFESKQVQLMLKKDVPLVQELKMVYVKYLHIIKEGGKPVYRKYIERLNESIDVYSEYNYYRFNKFNSINNSITLTDKSSGVVDLNILYPWKDIVFTDLPSRSHKGSITQDVSDSDAYLSVSTYYNGFKENNEDIGMKMEMDSLCARIIADFSSIIGFEKLFTREPDAYKMELNRSKTKLLGLERISEGIYHLEAYNLKKGEALLLDFHVNWDYLKENLG